MFHGRSLCLEQAFKVSRPKSFHPPVNQWGFPQQLADHPHPVVGVLEAAGPAGDGQVDGQHDDEHQQADQQEEPVLTTELDAWTTICLRLKKNLSQCSPTFYRDLPYELPHAERHTPLAVLRVDAGM